MNIQEFTFDTKDINLSLYKGILPVYMGNFYIRSEVRTGCPFGDAWGNVYEIHCQLLGIAFYMHWKHVILPHE